MSARERRIMEHGEYRAIVWNRTDPSTDEDRANVLIVHKESNARRYEWRDIEDWDKACAIARYTLDMLAQGKLKEPEPC